MNIAGIIIIITVGAVMLTGALKILTGIYYDIQKHKFINVIRTEKNCDTETAEFYNIKNFKKNNIN